MMEYQAEGFRAVLADARAGKYAIGAFNIFNSLTAGAVIETAEDLCTPVILQTSMGTVRTVGAGLLSRMIQALRSGVRVPVILHLDHCRDLDLLRECVDNGWDSVMIDASSLPFDENVALTRKAREYAARHGVGVEAEIGVISGVEEDISAQSAVGTNYEDAIRFLQETGVDALAPSIGTAHGIYRTSVNLNYELLRHLADTAGVPMVVHGGTGLSQKQFAELIDCGAAKINVSTAIKHAYLDSARAFLTSRPNCEAPLELDRVIRDSVKATVRKHMKYFRMNKKWAEKSGGLGIAEHTESKAQREE